MSSVLPISARKTGELARLLEERGYGDKDFQFLIENPDQVVALLHGQMKLVNPFTKKRVQSEYYPDGYESKPVADQLAVLAKLYPQLDGSQVAALASSWEVLPDGAELLQVVPKLYSVAKLHRIDDPYGTGYGKCLELMLVHIAQSRTFYNYRKGRLTDPYLRLLEHTRQALKRLEAETPGDYLVIPMQSGLRYAGSSVSRARWDIEHSGQWSLPSWVVGHHLLTHPERGVRWEQLHLDGPGDEYSPDADGKFNSALCFYFYDFSDHRLEFGSRWVDFAHVLFGSASGFLGE